MADTTQEQEPYFNMPHVKKLMTQPIDSMRSSNRNQISLDVLKSIKDKCESSLAQLTDNINVLMGGFITTSQIIESKEISKMMTDIFEDTNVKVYIYISSFPNAFTMPGTNVVSSPFLIRLQTLLSSPIIRIATYLSSLTGTYLLTLGNFFQLFLNLLEQVLTGIKGKFTHGATDYVSINPTNKKIKISTKDVSIYVSSNLIKLLNNDKELTAVLLHEVGHNVKLTYTIMENIVSMPWIAAALPGLYYEIQNAKINDNSLFYDSSYAIKSKSWLMVSIILFIFGLFISAYISRRNETYSDEFAIKCGYGKYMYSAIRKMHTISNEIFKKEEAKKSEGFMSKVLNSLSSILTRMEAYPEQDRREEMLKQKTDRYDTSKKNIDRTADIEKYEDVF